MRRQFRKEYKEGRKREEKSSFEIKDNPKVKEYYSSSYISSEKKPIITEKYKESSPNSKNIQSSNKYYKYYSEYKTPYNQRNQNMSQNDIFSKNESYYTVIRNMNNNYNSDFDGFHTSYKKQMIFGNTDLRNEYSPIADARVNIRKKLIEERNNYKSNINDDFSENFQYYETKNVRNKSDHKYDSITRIIGYSNIIPIHTQKMIYNYSNVDLSKNGKYTQKIEKKVEHDYRMKKNVNITQQKKEFKKPAQIETVKKQEIIKKYEVKKKPEIKKEEENKYKKYERKKEETVKKEVKEVKKTEIKQKKVETKKEVKEPVIIKRKENVKLTFATHSGRYANKNTNISEDILKSRKNYNANSQERNMKKVEIVQSSKSEKKIEEKNKTAKSAVKAISIKKEEPKTAIKRKEIIKKEEKTTKITTNVKPVVKKININENINMTNYKIKKEEVKKVQYSPKPMPVKRNITVKTESYGKLDDIYRRENIDIGNIINIKEINKLYEMKRKRNITPKMKTKKINLGDNYKYYERKYLQSPDDNYLIIHQRRNQRVIYGEEILESNVTKKMKIYKTKPLIREERYNNQIITDYKSPYNRRGIYDNEEGEYYSEQGGSYYY